MRQFACARPIDEYDVIMPVPHVRVTLQINCCAVTILSQKRPSLATMEKSVIGNCFSGIGCSGHKIACKKWNNTFLMLGLHRTPEGLGTDLRPKTDQTRGYSGVGRQGRMFLLCYSPEGHKLLLNTHNNSGLHAVEIDKLHDRFWPSKTVVELFNFSCEWPNSQLDPPLVASLPRLVVNHSVASFVFRHDRKSVASHSWNFYLRQTFAESDR